jgi:hypothetical protein
LTEDDTVLTKDNTVLTEDDTVLTKDDTVLLTKDDLMGGKLRRTRKRRMSKRRKNSRKSRKSKSRKMRGGGFTDYLPSFLKSGQKEQEIFDMRNEHNSGFENQPPNRAQPIKQYTDEEYKYLRENTNNIGSVKPVDNIKIKNNSWFSF